MLHVLPAAAVMVFAFVLAPALPVILDICAVRSGCICLLVLDLALPILVLLASLCPSHAHLPATAAVTAS